MYNAFRVPTRNCNRFVTELQQLVVVKAVLSTVDGFTDLDTFSTAYENQVPEQIWVIPEDRARKEKPWVREVDMSLHLYTVGRHTTMIPTYHLVRALDSVLTKKVRARLTRDCGMSDYSYWNNSDQPDDVPTAQWVARKRFWWAMFYPEQPYSVLPIFSTKLWSSSCVWSLSVDMKAPKYNIRNERGFLIPM